ncbi:MAG: TRAP transporter small permease [Eubacteriales bacterium]|jgi:C4-dicarboxylate transporter DctQ subunit
MNKIFNKIEESLAAVIMGLMLVLTFTNVIGRYFLSSAISFTEEITTSLFVLLCTLGAAIAVKKNAHLGLSIITERLSMKKQLYFSIFANLMGLMFAIILTITGAEMAYNEYLIKQISITLQWPEWIYGSFVPIGGIFLIVRFTQSILKNYKEIKKREVKS